MIINQIAFGPEPITIGIGPIKITTPTLAEDEVFSKDAATKKNIPVNTKPKPMIKNRKSLLEMAMPSASGSCVINKAFHLNK